jgi:hypothetical protein
MFRRRLKKEKSKYRLKLFFVVLLVLSVTIVAGEYLLTHFAFGRAVYISPVAKSNRSGLAPSNFLENMLIKNKISYESISVGSDGATYVVNLSNSGEVILSSKKDLGSQLTSLQLILSRLTIEGKKLKKLDFRFDNPVVEF